LKPSTALALRRNYGPVTGLRKNAMAIAISDSQKKKEAKKFVAFLKNKSKWEMQRGVRQNVLQVKYTRRMQDILQ